MKVDVLMPTYKPNPAHLREALDALLKQTYTEWLAFIHDDGSDTDAFDIVEPYLSDPRIRYEKSKERLGIGGNWNACFKRTESPVVAYLFQDDVWDPQYLERAVKVFRENPHVGFISMNHHYKIEGEIVTSSDYRELESYRDEFLAPGVHEGRKYLNEWIQKGLRPNVIGEPCFVVMKREVMEEVGPFHEEMPQSLDAEYWARLLQVTDWYFVKEKSGFFRVHASAATAQNREGGRGLFDRFVILQNIIDGMPRGENRKAARRAQVKQFEEMAQKFKQKKERGDTIKMKGAGVLKKFCLRHPIVTVQTLLRTKLRS